MVVAAAMSTTPNSKVLSRGGAPNQKPKPKRPPLLPSEADNGPRRPKSREVTSRYLSSNSSSTSTTTSSSATSSSYSSSSNSNSSTPRMFPSPLVSRTVPVTPSPAVNKRSQSAEKRRPATPRPGVAGEMSMSAKLLVTSSRSLSVSFQGESFAFPISKAKSKPAPAGNSLRNGTPERRKVGAATPGRDQTENSKPIEQHRWPGRSRDGNFLTRSVDFTNERTKTSGSESAVRALPKSMIDETRVKPKLEKTVNKVVNDSASVTGSVANSDHVASDTESVSSGGTSGALEVTSQVRGGPRGVVVPARFWQETNNRLRRVPEPGSPVSKNNKLFSANKHLNDGPILSPRGLSSPVRGAVRPASPSRRVVSSTPAAARGMASPTRAKNGVVASNGNLNNSLSLLSFAAEARGGKVGELRIVDAHLLRLLHNKHLQWRYANARADAAMSVQRGTAEKSLYNAWVTTTKLRHSVRAKRIEIQLLRQNLKMHYILKNQMPYLDTWDHAEKDHSNSLAGVIVALESSTLRLPVVAGAKADIQSMKDSIRSAVDVMQAIASSIFPLLTKVEHLNSLVSELASVTTNESAFLDQCKDLLSTLTAMQVKDCSLRTHILQLSRDPSSLTMEL